MAMGDEAQDSGGLNFDSANLENVATGLTKPFVFWSDALVPALAVLALFVCIYLSVRWAKKASPKNFPDSFLIRNWPAALRVALVPLIVSFALTHAFSVASVLYNTKIANSTTDAYFQAIGVGRLFSLSHAHLFAHATMYFLLAFLAQLTGARRFVTLYAPLGALWAGVFDVVSWWGFKKLSPNFEVLSALSGSMFSFGFLIMGYAILYSALSSRKDISVKSF